MLVLLGMKEEMLNVEINHCVGQIEVDSINFFLTSFTKVVVRVIYAGTELSGDFRHSQQLFLDNQHRLGMRWRDQGWLDIRIEVSTASSSIFTIILCSIGRFRSTRS